MKSRIKGFLFLCCTVAIFLLTGCEHKDLCYVHPHTARLIVKVDWILFTVEEPTGMTVIAYPVSGGSPVVSRSNNTSYTTMPLTSQTYNLLAFNQSESEFGTFSFEGTDSYETVKVVGRQHASRWYKTRSDDEFIIHDPEWLGVDAQQDITVTDEQLQYVGKVHAEGRSEGDSREYVIATMYPQNVIKRVRVRVHMTNIHGLYFTRAALSGMASECYLSSSVATGGKATHLLESWTKVTDADEPTIGYVEAYCTSFGLHDTHQGQADENILQFSVLLTDGNQLDWNIPVGDLIVQDAEDPSLLTIDYWVLDLPEVEEPEEGEIGGFNATVVDWGDEITTEIDM